MIKKEIEKTEKEIYQEKMKKEIKDDNKIIMLMIKGSLIGSIILLIYGLLIGFI